MGFRQSTRLQERIAAVSLPYNAQPGLDALTSPIGEIYRYTLESKTRDLRELSELQFWKVIPRLKQVAGLADVANFGGLTTEFQLAILFFAGSHLGLDGLSQPAIFQRHAGLRRHRIEQA